MPAAAENVAKKREVGTAASINSWGGLFRRRTIRSPNRIRTFNPPVNRRLLTCGAVCSRRADSGPRSKPFRTHAPPVNSREVFLVWLPLAQFELTLLRQLLAVGRQTVELGPHHPFVMCKGQAQEEGDGDFKLGRRVREEPGVLPRLHRPVLQEVKVRVRRLDTSATRTNGLDGLRALLQRSTNHRH